MPQESELERLSHKYAVDIVQKRGFCNTYIISDTEGKLIEFIMDWESTLPVENRVADILSTSRDELRAISAAKDIFYDDGAEMIKDYKVWCEYPSAMPIEDRVDLKSSQPGTYIHPFMDIYEYSIRDGKVDRRRIIKEFERIKVGLIEFVPGKHDYSPDELYKEGQLEAEFAEHHLNAYAKQIIKEIEQYEMYKGDQIPGVYISLGILNILKLVLRNHH